MKKKKDVLLEKFENQMSKVDLKTIYGGVTEITEGQKATQTTTGTEMDPAPDQRYPEPV